MKQLLSLLIRSFLQSNGGNRGLFRKATVIIFFNITTVINAQDTAVISIQNNTNHTMKTHGSRDATIINYKEK